MDTLADELAGNPAPEPDPGHAPDRAHDHPDEVVLLCEDGRPRGTAPRSEVHTSKTPLHLAFSCYVVDEAGRVLLTRRAVSKRTWPGVWTNSFCGHPRPGEDLVDALRRRGKEELGTTLNDVRCLLPSFRYRAVDSRGVVENELCPVFVATWDGLLSPDPDEVEELRWVTFEDLAHAADAAPWALSPWLIAQLTELEQAPRLADGSAVTARKPSGQPRRLWSFVRRGRPRFGRTGDTGVESSPPRPLNRTERAATRRERATPADTRHGGQPSQPQVPGLPSGRPPHP